MAGIRSTASSVASGTPRRAIIFDFDGTIADSFPVALQMVHELFGRQLGHDDISRLRGMNIRKVMHELRIPLWRAPFLAAKVRRRMIAHMDQIPIIPGLGATVQHLARTHQLFIVSSNSSANVQVFLRRFEIDRCFVTVYGGVLPWSKARVLRRLLRTYHLTAADTWYVGDADLDILAAHRAGTKAMAVAWGYSNIHILQQHHPEALVFTAEELERHFMKRINRL